MEQYCCYQILWCAYDWGDANVSYDQVLKK